MFLRKSTKNANQRSWRLFLGKDKTDSKSVGIIFHTVSTVNGYDKYRVYEPLILGDIPINTKEHKDFAEGFTVRRRMLKNFDLALEILLNYYKRLLGLLVVDKNINPYIIDKNELDYLVNNLPDNNTTKFIVAKLKQQYNL